ncbi:MAG: hypothetical protein C5B51_23770 [Terriglobia bacterium]|nr:MAG: hypothetical protein C5B51_23770 [Terriglobia bacterium]
MHPSRRKHLGCIFFIKASGWTGIWADTIYDYTHFHSNAHEVLGVAEGKVTLRLGGDEGSLVRLTCEIRKSQCPERLVRK